MSRKLFASLISSADLRCCCRVRSLPSEAAETYEHLASFQMSVMLASVIPESRASRTNVILKNVSISINTLVIVFIHKIFVA